MIILAVDPGLSGGCGFAIHAPGSEEIDCQEIAGKPDQIVAAIRRALAGRRVGVLVVEYPVKYPHRRDAWHAVDLLRKLLAQIKRELKPTSYVKYTPNEWKGTVPKHIHQQRVFKGQQLRHNEADAAALLLFHLGRITQSGLTIDHR